MKQAETKDISLLVIPTPIGNLGDISLRSIDAFKSLDILLCEDTRVTKKLINHLGIQVKLQSYHAHNEHRVTESIIEKIKTGARYGVVSDAGTPGISDPAYFLIRAAIAADINIIVIPGATALIPAIVGSGLPCDRFHFEGFLPHKKGRQTRHKYLATLENTFILYESPYRLIKCIKQLIEFNEADRQACVVREITKMYEEFIRGTLTEILADLESRPSIKGEIVIVVAGKV